MVNFNQNLIHNQQQVMHKIQNPCTDQRTTRLQNVRSVIKTNFWIHYAFNLKARVKHVGTENFTPLK